MSEADGKSGETKESNSTETKRDSYFKDGLYREYTNIYAVYHGESAKRRGTKGRISSKHDSVDEANKAAKALYDDYDTKTAIYAGLDRVGAYNLAQIAYFNTVIRIEVEELPLDKLNHSELKALANEMGNEADSELDKNGLYKLLLPAIQHKKHQNTKKEKDLTGCLMCEKLYENECKALQKERDNDPFWKKQTIFTKMYRKSLENPITEKQIKGKYGALLTDECLTEGVLEEKLHWRKKACFGHEYRVYEKKEIEAYSSEIKKNKNNKKRKYEEMNRNVKDDECDDQEPESKKRKLVK